MPWGPERLDWDDYWMNIHFPGLQKWVLPELDQTYAPKPKQIYSYHDLLELFDTTTKLHATRTALRIERGKREEIYSYADLQELASRIGVFLLGEEVPAAARVLLVAKNGPEWSMAFFGILKARPVVPVDTSRRSPRSSTSRAPRAPSASSSATTCSTRAGSRRPCRALAEAGLSTKLWPFSRAFELPDLAVETERLGRLARKHTPTPSRR